MCAGAGCGFSLSAKNKGQIAAVEAVEQMLCETELMLRYNVVTVGELVGRLKNLSQTRALKFLDVDEKSNEIQGEIIRLLKQNRDRLSDDQVFRIVSFFEQLGQTDLEGQIMLTQGCRSYFQTESKTLKSNSESKCRLYNSLGILGGALIAVMLV